MIIDLTPKAWSGHSRLQIGAVIAHTITTLEVVELRVSRHKLIAETHTSPSPDEIEALRVVLAQLGPLFGLEPTEADGNGLLSEILSAAGERATVLISPKTEATLFAGTDWHLTVRQGNAPSALREDVRYIGNIGELHFVRGHGVDRYRIEVTGG